MKNKILTLILILGSMMGLDAQTVLIPGDSYAFQWTGNPNIGLYFSATNSRYEFRDLSGSPEAWFNPILGRSYFRGRVGIMTTDPQCKLDVVTGGAEDAAISGRGILGPTNGYLGVQGTTDFDGITGLNLGGREIAVLGVSTGASSTDNFGLYGYSNGTGAIALNSTSGHSAELGTSTHAAVFSGKVQADGGDIVTLSSDGYIMTGSNTDLNMAIGRTRLQVRDGGVGRNFILQPYGGNVTIGTDFDGAAEKLRVEADSGQNVFRARVAGSTKVYVHNNGGTSLGGGTTVPPSNGLYVNGTVRIGSTTTPSGYKASIDGKVICEELTVQLSGDWPDYVFEEDYERLSFGQLREYIATNKHLPGVPSAAEVAQDGIQLGQVQADLLEKIEELTLYVLELEASNSELKERVDSLESDSK